MEEIKKEIYTGEANRQCYLEGISNEYCDCFFCGYQFTCDRKKVKPVDISRDHTGAYPEGYGKEYGGE